MTAILEVVAAFIATMIILSLAAQAIQDVVKNTFAIKGWTRFVALRRLVIESARTGKLGTTDGEDIMIQIVDRLRNLSQNGVRSGKVRLDVMTKEQLQQLIMSVDPSRVGALKPLTEVEGKARLAEIARESGVWFDLSQEPVVERYRRRMQLSAFLSGLVVVLALNADTFRLVKQIRGDAALRSQLVAIAGPAASADNTVRLLQDSLQAVTPDSAGIVRASVLIPAIRKAADRRDSIAKSALDSLPASFFGYPEVKTWQWNNGSWNWALGILVSTLLVGLGAPFWHDILETVFGLKNSVMSRTTGKETGRPGGKVDQDT